MAKGPKLPTLNPTPVGKIVPSTRGAEHDERDTFSGSTRVPDDQRPRQADYTK